MIKYYTVSCTYSATGEGLDHMILFTRAYPKHDRDYDSNFNVITTGEERAISEFLSIFGKYFLMFATVKPGLDFDNESAKFLISEDLKKKILDLSSNSGNFRFHSSMHVNFS